MKRRPQEYGFDPLADSPLADPLADSFGFDPSGAEVLAELRDGEAAGGRETDELHLLIISGPAHLAVRVL